MASGSADHVQLAKQLIAYLRENTVDKVAALLDDKVVMELPYAPKGVPNAIQGKAAVMESLEFINKTFKHFRINIHEYFDCKDRDVVILEGTSIGVPLEPAPIYHNRYVFVFAFRNGLVVSWKEFFNPYPVIWSQAAAGN